MLQILIICPAQDPIAKEKLFLTFTSKLLEKVKKMCKFLEAVKPARAGFPCKGDKVLFPATDRKSVV